MSRTRKTGSYEFVVFVAERCPATTFEVPRSNGQRADESGDELDQVGLLRHAGLFIDPAEVGADRGRRDAEQWQKPSAFGARDLPWQRFADTR